MSGDGLWKDLQQELLVVSESFLGEGASDPELVAEQGLAIHDWRQFARETRAEIHTIAACLNHSLRAADLDVRRHENLHDRVSGDIIGQRVLEIERSIGVDLLALRLDL